MTGKARGKVVNVPEGKPFGFIQTNAHASNIFIHKEHMPSGGWPKKGQALEFDIVETEKGPQARNVRMVGARPAPYTFVPVAIEKCSEDGFSYSMARCEKVPGHDGRDIGDRVSGQLFLTLTAHTPLLVGARHFEKNGRRIVAPWRLNDDRQSVVLAGTSLKGMIRHHLSALLNAPMERVKDQFFSYRPNAAADVGKGRFRRRCIVVRPCGNRYEAAVFNESELLPSSTPDTVELELPRGIDGSGILENLFRGNRHSRATRKRKYLSKGELEKAFRAKPRFVPSKIIEGYLTTQRELADNVNGHLSGRHPLVSDDTEARIDEARTELRKAAEGCFLDPRYLLYCELEYDSDGNAIDMVSLGHHFRYRWGYRDSIRQLNRIDFESHTRPEVAMHWDEGVWEEAEGRRAKLTPGRSLFGYSYDTAIHDQPFEGSHQRLAGRIAANHAVEVLEDRPDHERFVRNGQSRLVPLKELGSPKASAVEFYLRQDPEKNKHGLLSTYGDTVEGRDISRWDPESSELAGRKFYRHQPDAAGDVSCFLAAQKDRDSSRAPLAVDPSSCGSRFQFSLRFEDLSREELGALLFVIGIQHANAFRAGKRPESESTERPDYALKLGYARPLGWGSVTIALDNAELIQHEVEEDQAGRQYAKVATHAVRDVLAWRQSLVEEFLLALQQAEGDGHPSALDACLNAWSYADRTRSEYPRKDGKDDVFAFHSDLRTNHAKTRRAGRGKQVADATALTDPAKR